MKKHINPYKGILAAGLLLLTVFTSFAKGDPDAEKKKTYSKSYPLSGSDKISLNNQFGELKISTWDKSEIKVDITISARAGSEERAQEIMDAISIEDGKNSEGVFFKTHINNQNKAGKKGQKDEQKMSIDYMVYMPSGNPLNLENSFGKTEIPDLKGLVDITQKFGDLTAGKLSNVKELHVEFGKAMVEGVTNGKIVVKFSEAQVKKLSGAIKASFEFSGKVKMGIDNSVTEFTLTNSYSDIEINLPDNFGAEFDIRTNFGDFHNKTSLDIKEEKEDEDHGPKFDKTFTGKTGNGACKVKIKSSFGSIRFI
jgi:hypothetical protein